MDFSSLFCDFDETEETEKEETEKDETEKIVEDISIDDFIERQLELQRIEEEEQVEIGRRQAEEILYQQYLREQELKEKELKEKELKERDQKERELKERDQKERELKERERKRENELKERELKREKEFNVFQNENENQNWKEYASNQLMDLSNVFQGTEEWQQKYEDEMQQKHEVYDMDLKFKEDMQKMYQYVTVPPNLESSIGWFCLPNFQGPKKPDFSKRN